MRMAKEEEAQKKKIEEKKEIARKQQEQLVAIQAQLQVLTGGGVVEAQGARLPQVFNGTSSRVSSFVEECKAYIGKNMKGVEAEEQILWALSYVQGGLTDMWKEKVLEELNKGLWEYRTVEEFLKEIKKKFRRKEKKEKEKVWENLDEGLQGFLKDMEKEFGKNKKKEREKSYRIEEDV